MSIRHYINLIENALEKEASISPAFAAWFGNSKVVDRNGNPLIVYHGTQDQITSFYPGTHFGSSRAANHRLNDRRKTAGGGNQSILPVYLRITNPLEVSDMEASDEAALLNAIIRERREKDSPDEIGKFDAIDLNTARREGAYHAAKMAGFDGLVYVNHVEDRGQYSWVIFSPTQVKFAISNNENFHSSSSAINEDTQDSNLSYALWWLQRWISGSMNDPDWEWPEAETMTLDQAFAIIGKTVGNRRSTSKPVIWRSIIVTKAMARKIKQTLLLPPNRKSLYQSFSRSRKVAEEFGAELDCPKGWVHLLMSIRPDPNIIPFGMADLKASRNGEVQNWLMALGDWHHQDEVMVRISEPLKLLDATIVEDSP